MPHPLISFAVASFNSAAFLEEAVRSALEQRDVSVEVLIVDDHSVDGSREVAERLAREDARVRTFQTAENAGPGGARNIAIAAARGEWLAVLDSDDLLHPDRSARLIAEAERSGADMVADDLLLFDNDRRAPPSLFLRGARARQPGWIDLESYFEEARMFGRKPNPGFLKPLIRSAFLRDHAIRYDETLRIAEDDDLIIRCLRAGGRYRILPEPLYLYRKHASSISHRLSADHADRMKRANDRLVAEFEAQPGGVSPMLRRRSDALMRAWAFTHIIDALSHRDLPRAVALSVRHPAALRLFRLVLAGKIAKLLARMRSPRRAVARDPRTVMFVSRQRLLGATSGSSTYLLAVAQAVRAAGLVPHLLQPSPLIFGRTPFFRLLPEMQVFETHRVRGAARLGSWVFALQPDIYLQAALGIGARLARRVGWRSHFTRDRKAPYAIAAPWTREDIQFAAAGAEIGPAIVIADYVFQTEAFPYLAGKGVRTATVMHDLFHARSAQFEAGGDSVVALDRATELRLLGSSQVVLAIQASEAEFVREQVPQTRSILVPMPAQPVARASAGDADTLLFVGSNTAPNVLGLRWFLEQVWPTIRAARPATRLDVAGTVRAAFDEPFGGVTFHGLVPDLAASYARAGVVISPLHQGSGLKIKLIEALAHGKACVVTGVTLQGVEWLADGAVARADDPGAFAAVVLALQENGAGREALAHAGLEAARSRFGSEAAFREFTAWLRLESD